MSRQPVFVETLLAFFDMDDIRVMEVMKELRQGHDNQLLKNNVMNALCTSDPRGKEECEAIYDILVRLAPIAVPRAHWEASRNTLQQDGMSKVRNILDKVCEDTSMDNQESKLSLCQYFIGEQYNLEPFKEFVKAAVDDVVNWETMAIEGEHEAQPLVQEPTFKPHEVGSSYVIPGSRFVVSLIVGYGGDNGDGVTTPRQALAAAVDLTSDEKSYDTKWHVFDRSTGVLHVLEQMESDPDDYDGVAENDKPLAKINAANPPCHPHSHRYPTKCPHCNSDLTAYDGVMVDIKPVDDDDDCDGFAGRLDAQGWLLDSEDGGDPIKGGRHVSTQCSHCDKPLDQYEIKE